MMLPSFRSLNSRRVHYSVLLLLALVTHLLLMVSPLHAAEPQLGQRDGTSHEHLGSSALVATGSLPVHHGHCAMEWTTPRPAAADSCFGPGAFWSQPFPEVGPPATRPLARALGPPCPLADRQALLQVFRC
jgi:hypothetical protein